MLVLLHLDEQGELCVTLTTRAKHLRSHPGETALPGGRFELEHDRNVQDTALREAWEEINVPADDPDASLLYLTTLSPFSSRTLLVVTPVVYFLPLGASAARAWLARHVDPNADEVDAVFSAQLRAFLGHTRGVQHEHEDFVWLNDSGYRLHIFKDRHWVADCTGLTADILIATALLAFHGVADCDGPLSMAKEKQKVLLGYERWARGQLAFSEIVRLALLSTDPNARQGLAARRPTASDALQERLEAT